MATETTNYGLKKPEASDFYNVEDFNGNFDKIDGALKNLEGADENWKDTAVAEAVEQMDSSGNSATAERIKSPKLIAGLEFDGSYSVSPYAVCNTGATTQEKKVTVPHINLVNGARIVVNFVNGISVDEPTLNVSNLGAKKIRYQNKYLDAYAIPKGSIVGLVYTGNSWEIEKDLFFTGSAPDFFGSNDLNDYTRPGRYVCHVSPDVVWENAPSGWHTCWLEIHVAQDIITQVLTEYDGQNIYIRGYYNTWSAWRKISGTAI